MSENRINLWDSIIPGNSDKNKSDVMELGRTGLGIVDTIRWVLSLKKQDYKDCKKIIDTYTMNYVIPKDPDSMDTFTDCPYLIPFIAKDSKKCVVVVPGGGYCLKEMENEGTKVAEFLQKNGISAFVLWYRCCPYYQPIPIMDLQRAIRLVRSLSDVYGYEKDGIGAVGFSAGGAQVSLFLNLFMGKEIKVDDTPKDALDDVSDKLDFAGLIYPAVGYRYNKAMQYASFPKEMLDTKEKRIAIEEEYDALHKQSSASVPQFLCYGTKDDMVSLDEIKQYYEKLKASNGDVYCMTVEGAGHGFGASTEKYNFWLDKFVEWVKER